jgi:hypothetical protein
MKYLTATLHENEFLALKWLCDVPRGVERDGDILDAKYVYCFLAQSVRIFLPLYDCHFPVPKH